MRKQLYTIKSRPQGVLKAQGGLGFGNASLGLDKNKYTSLYGNKAGTLPDGTDLTSAATGTAGGASGPLGGANPALGAGIGIGSSLINMGGQALIERNKDESTNSFGLTDPDEKSMVQGSTLSGVTSGAAMGASIGSLVPGIGTAIGAAGGAVVGGVAGFIKGKKSAGDAQSLYNKNTKLAMTDMAKKEDLRRSASLYGKNGIKTGSFSTPRSANTTSVIKAAKGAKLTTPGEINVIPKGKLHKENNNLGNKDKGIPVINAKGEKEYEIEKEELILRRDATITVEGMVDKINKGQDSETEPLGKYLADELLKNTQDYSDKFKVKVT